MWILKRSGHQQYVEQAGSGGVSTSIHRDRAKRFPTIEAAQAFLRMVPQNRDQRYMIVPAEEDRK